MFVMIHSFIAGAYFHLKRLYIVVKEKGHFQRKNINIPKHMIKNRMIK